MSHPGETRYHPFGSESVSSGARSPDRHWFGPQDLYLFNEGSHLRLYDKLGSHPIVAGGVPGYHFSVWAPNADYVSVVGDFNAWDQGRHPLQMVGSSGVWAGFIPGVEQGVCYKYHIAAPGGFQRQKTDPFAFTCEVPPKTAAVTWDLNYNWGDAEWMATRKARGAHEAPISIYEVHLGSWMRQADPPYHSLNYRELGDEARGLLQGHGLHAR